MESRLRWGLLGTLLLVFGAPGARAICGPVENPDIIEWNCEGGSVEDVLQVPANVEKLQVTRMPVGRLDERLLSRFGPSLLVFSCSFCAISEVDERAFRALTNLQQLSLNNNELREVPARCFDGLAFLTYLDLNNNRIERLEPEFFDALPSIVDLRLSGNQLRCVDLNALSRLRELKRIFISENPDFGCPNALRKFLDQRGIDYETDPLWLTQPVDRITVSEPSIPPPSRMPTWPSIPSTPPPNYWTTEERPRWTTLPPTTMPPVPRRPAYSPPPEIQPAAPSGDFAYQGPYYSPTVATPTRPSPMADYRERSNATTKLLVAGHQPTKASATTQETTTECPSAAPPLRLVAPLILVVAVGAVC